MSDYVSYLIDVACETAATQAQTPFPPIDPIDTITEFLRRIASPRLHAVTRIGVECATDILCTHPAVTTLFQNSDVTDTLADILFTDILPYVTPLFRDYWDYIIAPILNEHAATQRLLVSAASPRTAAFKKR